MEIWMKRILISVILSLSIAFVVSPAFSQNRYYLDGQNGISIAGTFQGGEDYTAFGAIVDFTVNGIFDLGVGLARASFDQDEYGPNFSSFEVSPYLLVSLVRPSGISSVGFDLGFSYGSSTSSGDVLDANNVDMLSSGYNAGGEVYFNINSSPGLRILPALSISYTSVTSKIESDYGGSEEETVSGVSMGAEVSFFLNHRVFIVPAFRYFEESAAWGIKAGWTIPTS